jgi:hypothetical protein
MAPYEHLNSIFQEYLRAARLHPPFNSAHEGYAIVLEELDEVWFEVKCNNLDAARAEMLQVAAMALRFLVDTADEK